MNLNKTELKKIMYDFNSYSNRLLQVAFEDYTSTLSKFLTFINNTEIIYSFIISCGECTQNMEHEFQEISENCGRAIFSIGESENEEVRDVYAILSYIVEHNVQIHYWIAMGYSHEKSFQSKVDGFNKRVVSILINNIERYLTKIGIDMGMDEKVSYNISVENGQVIIASDNASVQATTNIGVDIDKLATLIQAVRSNAQSLSAEDKETVESNLEVIQEEVKVPKPRKRFIKTAIDGLKLLKGTVEFAAAVTTLATFLMPLIGA